MSRDRECGDGMDGRQLEGEGDGTCVCVGMGTCVHVGEEWLHSWLPGCRHGPLRLRHDLCVGIHYHKVSSDESGLVKILQLY